MVVSVVQTYFTYRGPSQLPLHYDPTLTLSVPVEQAKLVSLCDHHGKSSRARSVHS